MENVQWSGGNSYGTTAHAISFGSDLLMKSCLNFCLNWIPKIDMAWHQWANKSHHHHDIATPIVCPIWRMFNGLEATHMVS
jgi:hypothetical protein